MKHTIKEHRRSACLPPIEQRVLACSTELYSHSRYRQDLQHLISLIDNKNLLIDIALKEGLACILYKNLVKSGAVKSFDYKEIERLQYIYYQTLASNLRLCHDLREVLHRLNHRNIQVVLLQGAVLLQQLYDDIGLRPLTDIDLWVSRGDLPELVQTLNNIGYQRDHLYPNTLRKGSTTIDLHTHILWADRIEARSLLLRNGQSQILKNTKIIHFEGQQVRCLHQYDQVLYLGLHALKHNVDRLLWLVDIRHLVSHWQASEWRALMNRAGELGLEKPVRYILYLLSQLFGFHPSHEMGQAGEGRTLNSLEKKVLRQRLKQSSLPVWASLLLLSAGQGLRARCAFLVGNAFPRPEVLQQVFADYPNLGGWRLYMMRTLQLLSMIRPATIRF